MNNLRPHRNEPLINGKPVTPMAPWMYPDEYDAVREFLVAYREEMAKQEKAND